MREPLRKSVDVDDPMELRGFECDGDPDYMIDCLVEEYVRLGWPPEKILGLFEAPGYPMLHALWHTKGPETIRRKIERVARRTGVFRFRTVEQPLDDEPVRITTTKQGA